MGRCSLLTDYEKGRIEGMRDCGTSLRKIASQIGRSHNVVNNYLKNKSGYGKKKNNREATESVSRRKKAWEDVPMETVEKLSNSMHKRCIEVIKAKGSVINY